MARQPIQFHIGETLHTVLPDDVTPKTSLNTYLREIVHLTGTKRMCLEGGCGSCVVAVEELDPRTQTKTIFSINSCLVSIFSCHGWKIHIIEGIGDPLTKYHPLQTILAENNGTQCGFCSPGMIMNMYSLYESGPLTNEQIENSFGGNICRCTGYRPILAAFKSVVPNGNDDIEDYIPCYKRCDGTKDCQKLCKDKLQPLSWSLAASKWMKVYFISDLLEILRTIGDDSYMLVAGNTAKGIYRPPTTPNNYIDVTDVKELITYSLEDDALTLGGNLTLTKTMQCFNESATNNAKFSYLSKMASHIDLVANVPVRNIGTLAGNLMIKYGHNEFQSDIFVIFETVNAILVIVDLEDNETRCSPKDFLKLDMSKKIIKNIILPGMDDTYKYGSYKIMRRAQNVPALVNAGFLFEIKDDLVSSATIVYGAINPDFIHATNTENILKSKPLFDNSVLEQAFQTLDDELKPDYVLPAATPEFRKQLAISLLYKFILSIAPSDKISARNKSGASLLVRPVSSGTQEFGSNKDMYPVTEPKIKIEALAQTSGQAEYIADIPDLPHQLFAAFVLAKTVANSTITKIDTSKAMTLTGVVAFYGKDDIPGENTFTPKYAQNPIQEELFCSGRVQFYAQPVGVIVAETQEIAQKAADLVQITYTAPQVKPLLTIQDVLNAKATDRIQDQTTVVAKNKGNDVKQVVKGTFFIGFQYHFHMEVQCCNVVPTEDGINVWPASQWMDATQLAIADVLDIPTSKINIFVRRLGGAFGGKISRNNLLSTATALAASKLNRPVKMWMPLETNMLVVGKRFPLLVNYEVGVNDDGVIQYLDSDLYTDIGAGGNELVDEILIDLYENVYNFDTWSFTTHTVKTDTHANTWTRSPGSLEGLAAIESIMEHIASQINKDPFDVKMANMDHTKHPKIDDFITDMNSWAGIKQRQEDIVTYNNENRWRKRGLAIVPMAWSMVIGGSFSVYISIFHGDGSVAISHGGIEIGQGINTKVTQVCAYKFGIPMEKISVKPSYNVVSPNCSVTGGSITSEAICYSVIKTCDILLARMQPVRDKMDNPTWEELVNECYDELILLGASASYSEKEPGIENYLIYGLCATEVEVDILTGKNQILRVDIIEDVGDSISPLIDIGQTEGAFVMGIGYYTTEEIISNDQGEILTTRTLTYDPPGPKDIPIDFRIKFPTNNPNSVGVLKSKAIGEPPLCLSVAVPLAIRHAVSSARTDANSTNPKWYPFDGCSSVENTFLNSFNDYNQYIM